MKKVIVLLLVLAVVTNATDFKRHSFTLSSGIPGLILPELGYEYSFDAQNKIGVAAGTFLLWPEYRLSYIRMISSFELAGSAGFVPEIDNEEEGFLDDLFESILSGGTGGAKFISATAGYRHSADGGFIFRVAGGGGYFFNSDDSRFIPFLQLGIGYGF